MKVEESHKAWSEALGQLGRQASQAGKSGVKWGSWGWWICVEAVLIWSVFRYVSLSLHGMIADNLD
jgi:hypothetical protein